MTSAARDAAPDGGQPDGYDRLCQVDEEAEVEDDKRGRVLQRKNKV